MCSHVEKRSDMENRHISEAHKWLGHLRNGTDMYDSFIGHVRKEAHKGNLTLEDVGTSEAELAEVKVKGCKTAANKWLGHLRNGTDMYDSFIGHVRKEAHKGNLTLEDVGTSEAELAEVKVKGCKTAANKWLGHLRNGTDMYDSFIGHVREEAQKGGLTLEDVGTSEAELAEVKVKGCKTAANKWLGHLRNGTDMYDSFIGHVREEAQKGGLTLEDVGTSEEELASLNRHVA